MKNSITILLTMASTFIFAQQVDITRVYNRNSVSFIMTSHPGDEFDAKSLDYFANNNIGGKYNLNPITEKTYVSPYPRNNQMLATDKAKEIENFLNEKEVARQIFSYWYNRQPDGTMDYSIVHQRGKYNASDEKKDKANRDFRGDTLLMDEGEELIKKSYIVVFDVYNISKTMFESTATLVWTGTVDVHLFAVDLNDDIQNAIYENWIDVRYPEPDSIKQIKKENFDKIPFKMKHVITTTRFVQADNNILMANAMAEMTMALQGANYKKPVYTGNGESEFKKFIYDMYTQGMESLEVKRPDFKVKTPIYTVSPIKAPIGLKEGLRRSQLYGVYSVTLIPESNEPIAEKIGSIRATKVVNNQMLASGNAMQTDLMTRFAIESCIENIEPGMFIEQLPSKTATFYADFIRKKDAISMFSIGIRNQNFITTQSLTGSLLLDLAFYNNVVQYASVNESLPEVKNFSVCMRLGYALGFNFINPNVKIEPFFYTGLGGGSNASIDVNDADEDGYIGGLDAIISYGSNFIVNIKYPLQTYVKFESTYCVSSLMKQTAIGIGLRY